MPLPHHVHQAHPDALSLSEVALQAQSCFVQEDDATGSVAFSTAQLAELEAAACSLRAVFPPEFQADFAVYDFGFYLHQESYVGGTPQVFQDKIAKIEQQTPYFLVFGRQLLRGGALGKVWVEVRLPEEGSFVCYESDYFDVLQFKVQTAVLQALELGSVAMAEEEGIEKLTTFIQDIVECCDPGLRNSCSLCSWTYDDILDYHEQMGFVSYDTQINPSTNGLDSMCLCSYNYQMNNTEYILSTGAVNMSVSFSMLNLPGIGTLSATDMFSFLADLGEFYAAEGTSFYAALSDQTMFCSSSDNDVSALRGSSVASVGHDEIEVAFTNSEVGIWYNVLYTDHTATLAVKVKGVDVERAWLLLADGEVSVPALCCSEPDEIESDIEILTLEAPNSDPLSSFTWKIGGNAPRGNTEDITSSQDADDTGILLAQRGNTGLPWSDDDLFSIMKRLFNVTSVCGNKQITQRFIEEFRENQVEGKEFWYLQLSNALAEHPTIRNYIKVFGLKFGNIIEANDGVLPMPQSVYIDMDQDYKRPQFNEQGNCSWSEVIGYDRSHGYQILINDTEETRVYIHPGSYSYDGTMFWQVKVTIVIYDHFGLDKNDAITYQSVGFSADPINVGIGFAAWWRLQHTRGYKPFRTKIVLNAFIKGKHIIEP